MFKFEHPQFLFLLAAIPAMVLVLLLYRAWRVRSLRRFSGQAPVRRSPMVLLSSAFFLLAWAAMSVTMANPQRNNQVRVANTQQSSDVLIALDLSNSMLADDIKPDRLSIAKLFAQQLVQKLAGNRIGLLFFAGSTYKAMPFSTDYNAAYAILAQADPAMLSAQGTDLGQLITVAKTTFDPTLATGRALVIITDGENHESDAAAEVASAFEELGLHTIAVGAGTSKGGTIPIGLGPKRDKTGQVIITKLNEQVLSDIAEAGQGGNVLNITQGRTAIEQIGQRVQSLLKQEVITYASETKETIFTWFLLPAFLLLCGALWLSKK